MEVGSLSLPPCVTSAPSDLALEWAPAGGRDGSEQVGWAMISPLVLSQLERADCEAEGRRAQTPPAGSSDSPFSGAFLLPPQALPVRV